MKLNFDTALLTNDEIIKKLEDERLDLECERDEVKGELQNFCDNCDELIDVGGNEEFWGEVCHCPDWECPYEFNRYAKYDVCPERAELEERYEKLETEINKLDECLTAVYDAMGA